MNVERIRRVVVKEFIHILRDPRMKAVIFLVPVLQTMIFGYAVTTDVRHVALGVCNLDRSVASRELVARFEESGCFNVIARPADDAAIRNLLDRGEVRAVLRLAPGFEGDLLAGRTGRIQMLLDGTDSNTAAVTLDYGARIVEEFSRVLLAARRARLAGAARPPPRVDLQMRAWFNENLESRNFYVPGVIAMLVMLVTLLLTSMAVVREKEVGTIEQVMVTPITRAEFILGKSIPFALIGLVDVILVTFVGVFWFDVPIRGHLSLLLLSTGLYLMTGLGIGLLISTVSQTQQQAMMSTFFFYFPAVLLSGFMFPIANMPRPIQWLTLANPLRHFLVILRGIFLKGVGVAVLWPQMLALLVIGLLVLRTATGRFRKTMT
jgi:ABC-2 type transport system permease protein